MKKIEQQNSVEELAMDLLDFCGGSLPTLDDMSEWIIRRGYKLNANERHIIHQMTEAFLEECFRDLNDLNEY